MGPSAFFKVNNVMMNFGRMQALANVNFEVKKREIFGIAGPNGAGKTTLLNVISGALRPSGGTIFLEGKKISDLKPMEICHEGVGRIFQIPQIFSTLTVSQNIEVGLVFGKGGKKEPSRSVSEVLDFVQLSAKENLTADKIDLYSRKLLMLGAALATDPKMLLLDEPLGGLNYQEIEDYLQLIKKLNKETGTTFLIVEHIFDKLIELSQRVLILDFGEPIYLGFSKEVMEDPKVIEVYLGMKNA